MSTGENLGLSPADQVPAGLHRWPPHDRRSIAGFPILAATLTLPSIVLAKFGPSLEAFGLAVGFYAIAFFIVGPVDLARTFLLAPLSPVGRGWRVRPAGVLLVFILVLGAVNGLAFALSGTSIPDAFKWLILIGAILLPRWVIRHAIQQATLDGRTRPSPESSTSNERNAEMSQPNSPEQVFRAGTVSAAIWRKETTQDGRTTVSFSVRIQKRFKSTDSGEWKSTDYFFPEDLPRLELVAREAFRYVALKENEQTGSATE